MDNERGPKRPISKNVVVGLLRRGWSCLELAKLKHGLERPVFTEERPEAHPSCSLMWGPTKKTEGQWETYQGARSKTKKKGGERG